MSKQLEGLRKVSKSVSVKRVTQINEAEKKAQTAADAAAMLTRRSKAAVQLLAA